MSTPQNTTLHIGGMDCNNCAISISNMLRKKGLSDAQVNFATGEASFTLNEKVKIEDVTSGIESMGYKVLSGENQGTEKFGIGLKLVICSAFTFPLLLHMVPGMTFLNNHWLQLSLSLPVVVIGFLHFGRSAWGSVRNLFPNMDVLIFTGFMAAFIYSIVGVFSAQGSAHAHNYLFFETAASIITLVLLGNFIEHKAVKRTAASIDSLVQLKPQKAHLIIFINNKEKIIEADVKNIKKGDVVFVPSGEKIPADGEVISGNGYADQSMFTGESEAVLIEPGKKAIGGCILTEGNIRVRVENTGDDAYLNKLISMVKKASFNRPAIQKLGDKVSAVFVPLVISVSILTFFVAHYFFKTDLFHAFMNALAVLVISCPCAMGLATPTAVMVGIGRAVKNGILIRGGDTLQVIAQSKQFLFDKTGTLTTGDFVVSEIKIHDPEIPANEIHDVLFALESYSTHPVAKSVCRYLQKNSSSLSLIGAEEIKGVGVKARTENGDEFFLGSQRVLPQTISANGAKLFLLKNGRLVASVFMEDELKEGAKELCDYFKGRGLEPVMLTGDVREKAEQTAGRTGISQVFYSLLPEEKLSKIEELKKQGHVVMVGDGINDAPSLTAASAGISFAEASDIAVQSASVVVMSNNLTKLRTVHLIARHTLLTIKQNLFWAFCYNAVAIPLAATGYLNPMWGAAFMAFSDVMVIGNSLRLRYKKLS